MVRAFAPRWSHAGSRRMRPSRFRPSASRCVPTFLGGLAPRCRKSNPYHSVRKMEADLWEVRVRLEDRIARVLFTIKHDVMVLLHGFIKKGRKTPRKEPDLARKRPAQVKAGR